ncbi:MAG TPA: hypothetical protein VFU14_20225 [Acidimicrobiales bacterium]|nr:hypothetical protein [Acidimicrobiales bacterium]
MSDALARVRVVAASAVTWLVAAASAVTIVREEIVAAFPEAAEPVAAVAVPLLAGLGAAVAIIRRVTPVVPSERGVLPSGR